MVGKWFGVIAKWFVRRGVRNEEEMRKPRGVRSSVQATRARQGGEAEGGEWRGKRSDCSDEFDRNVRACHCGNVAIHCNRSQSEFWG